MLYNSIGQAYDLNSLESFFHEIGGFGFTRKTDYEEINSQFVETDEELSRPEPFGKIRFKTYEKYLDFVKFIQKKPLTLIYTAAEKYYLLCDVAEIDKTELETIGLNVSVKFIGKSLWYKDIIQKINRQKKDGKIYPYTYPYVYASNTSGSVVIENDSMLESPIIMTICGPCINPSWIHYVNGKMENSGKVICDIKKGKRLIISSKMPYAIYETDIYGRDVIDRYQDSDFTTERFILLKNGTNKIAFTHEGSGELTVITEAMLLYESV